MHVMISLPVGKTTMLRRLFRLKSFTPPKLGRWQLTENNSMQQLRKIDLANCDSCGTCTPPPSYNVQDAEDAFIDYHIAIIPYHTIV